MKVLRVPARLHPVLGSRLHDKTGIVFNSMYPGCIAMTSLFREKREWFRYFFFPTLMKAIGSYVTQNEAGERLSAVIADEGTAKSVSTDREGMRPLMPPLL